MLDTLFINADVITMEDARPLVRNGCVGVRGERIAYVGSEPPEEPTARRVDCTHKILMPGLVNTHAHTAMCLMRGYADDYTLQDWLFKKVFPTEARLDRRAVVAGARLGFLEMLSTGTTSASDMYYFQPAVAEAALQAGIRVSLCNAVVAVDPKSYDPGKDRAMRETIELAEGFHNAGCGRIKAEASIHGEYTSTPAIRKLVLDLADQYGLGLQIHVSETRKEQEECLKRHGKTPVAVLAGEGVFERRTIAAHCVHVTREDMDILCEYGVSAAHCPVSNLKLASGIADAAELAAHGVNVSLGTDGCCSNNTHDLFEEIKLSALLAKHLKGDPAAFTAYDALKLATVGGAKAQGREKEIGRIVPGLEADLILLDMDTPSTRPVIDPISAVVYSATGANVCFTMVQGKTLYENGRFTTLDPEEIYREAEGHGLDLVLER